MKTTTESGIIYKKWGGSEELEFTRLPSRITRNREKVKLKSDELLVSVKSISINPIDWKIMSGSQRFVASSRFPRIFGSDFSGEIIKTGSNTGDFQLGDRVMGLIAPLNDGSGRQWLKVKASHCIKIPQDLSYQEAASLPEACISAIEATRFSAKREPGKALVIGAGGGVGSIAVQILSTWGWDVSAVCREDQQSALKEFGITRFFDRNNWKDEIHSSTEKWDLIIDSPAAIIKEKPARYLNRGGYYSPVFIPDPFIPAQVARIVLWTFRSVSTGILLGYPSQSRMETVEYLINKGIVKPLIDSVWKAEDCANAVKKSIGGGVTGKIIINLPDSIED